MSITLIFGAVATPPVGGSWAVHISQYGRVGAVGTIPVNSGGPFQKIETIAESGVVWFVGAPCGLSSITPEAIGGCSLRRGGGRLWTRILAYITGSLNQELHLRNEYLAAGNRISRAKLGRRRSVK
jgi:hypothetical protein